MIQPNKLLPPVALWGILQFILLGIGASGFPLWAHHPLPRESLALPILLCGQILFSSMLFPVLAKTGWALAINLILMLPFDLLAGLLSNSSQLSILQNWACVGLWMLGLGFWRNYKIVTTLATLFTVGGAILDYLRWESFLADGRQEAFQPHSFLSNICQAHWSCCWSEGSIPAIAAVLALPFTKVGGLKWKSPLSSTEANIGPKSRN